MFGAYALFYPPDGKNHKDDEEHIHEQQAF